MQVHNDWHIDEWRGTDPGRFIPMALPVIWDAELCAAEVRRSLFARSSATRRRTG
jgi:hypothetical protein